jgi:hypothetical protein
MLPRIMLPLVIKIYERGGGSARIDGLSLFRAPAGSASAFVGGCLLAFVIPFCWGQCKIKTPCGHFFRTSRVSQWTHC